MRLRSSYEVGPISTAAVADHTATAGSARHVAGLVDGREVRQVNDHARVAVAHEGHDLRQGQRDALLAYGDKHVAQLAAADAVAFWVKHDHGAAEGTSCSQISPARNGLAVPRSRRTPRRIAARHAPLRGGPAQPVVGEAEALAPRAAGGDGLARAPGRVA